MLVNNIDIGSFKTQLLKKDIQTAEVIIYDDWLRQSLNPLYLGKKEKYKQIKLEFLVEENSDDSALSSIGNLVGQLEKCTIKFDDLSYYYDSLIVNKSHQRKAFGKYLLNVELKSPYAYKPEVTETLNHVSSKTINVPGNLNTPTILEITPEADMIDLTITGLGNAFKINNLKANQMVIIDADSCLVTMNGANKYGDTDMWEFPELKPGSNTITVSNANCIINIKYKPRYL